MCPEVKANAPNQSGWADVANAHRVGLLAALPGLARVSRRSKVYAEKSKQGLRSPRERIGMMVADSGGFAMRQRSSHVVCLISDLDSEIGAGALSSRLTKAMGRRVLNPGRHRSDFLRSTLEGLLVSDKKTSQSALTDRSSGNFSGGKSSDDITGRDAGPVGRSRRQIYLERSRRSALVISVCVRFRKRAEAFVAISDKICVGKATGIRTPSTKKAKHGMEGGDFSEAMRQAWTNHRCYFMGLFREIDHQIPSTKHIHGALGKSGCKAHVACILADSATSVMQMVEGQDRLDGRARHAPETDPETTQAMTFLNRLAEKIIQNAGQFINQDGQGTRSWLAQIFNLLGVTKDQELQPEDLSRIMQRLQLNKCEYKKLGGVFAAVSVNDSEKITIAEFAMFMKGCGLNSGRFSNLLFPSPEGVHNIHLLLWFITQRMASRIAMMDQKPNTINPTTFDYQRWFEAVDSEGVGSITKEGFMNMARYKLGIDAAEISDGSLRRIYEIVDDEGSEVVTTKEFAAFMRGTSSAQQAAVAVNSAEIIASTRAPIADPAKICQSEDGLFSSGDSGVGMFCDTSQGGMQPVHWACVPELDSRLGHVRKESTIKTFPMALSSPDYRDMASMDDLRLRLEVLWEELNIPCCDRDFFILTFCGDACHKNIVAKHVECLLRHRRCTRNVVEAIKRRNLALFALHQAVQKTTSDATLPILRSLAVATENVLVAVSKWRQGLWNHLPFLYEGVNYVHAMADDVADLLSSSLKKTRNFLSSIPMQDYGSHLAGSTMAALLSEGLDSNTVAFLLPRHVFLPAYHVASAMLNEASLVAATRRDHCRLLEKGSFTPRLK